METERMRILEMLQQGQIDAEQASRLLEALEESYRTQAPPQAEQGPALPPDPTLPPGADWERFGERFGRFGENLGEWISQRVHEALRGRGRSAEEATGGSTRDNYSSLRFTRSYLSRLPDGTRFDNYGEIKIGRAHV